MFVKIMKCCSWSLKDENSNFDRQEEIIKSYIKILRLRESHNKWLAVLIKVMKHCNLSLKLRVQILRHKTKGEKKRICKDSNSKMKSSVFGCVCKGIKH